MYILYIVDICVNKTMLNFAKILQKYTYPMLNNKCYSYHFDKFYFLCSFCLRIFSLLISQNETNQEKATKSNHLANSKRILSGKKAKDRDKKK